MQEENYNSVSEFRFLDPSEYADLGPRIGRIYGYDEFINKLRKIGLNVLLPGDGPPAETGSLGSEGPIDDAKVAGWIQRPFMIEYEAVVL